MTIGRDCERLAAEQPPPDAGVRVGGDVLVSVAEHRAALASANANLRATRRCQAQQRQRLAR